MALSEDLGFLLSRASGLVVRSTNAALADSGLRVRAYSVLELACIPPGGRSQRVLAEVLGLDPSQVVQLVDELSSAGLVERLPSPTDGRAKLVAGTPRGRQVLEQAAALAATGQQEQLSCLSAEEQATLRSLLSRVVQFPG
ncbi:MarR family winged helix-turn-helix transcriptional regulator [Blastococcus saxobsidens]|uniref:Transcriptional regulator, MarR family n=1 Tax=Blastococcus saxobsidens (strain DD2) TaxID=1146883 RepID=H6RX02_BLASD|nr:MarR family transcriptional regulator [Blastococcus saxobsidens]CCG03410.1 Transcriptional regulator, MarR family [Blastococcus saxobsidens DD2]